jgi:hypothetical protein
LAIQRRAGVHCQFVVQLAIHRVQASAEGAPVRRPEARRGMHKLQTGARPWCSRRASLVHNARR